VIVRRAECLVTDSPARREDDKVCDGDTRSGGLARQHREYTGVLEYANWLDGLSGLCLINNTDSFNLPFGPFFCDCILVDILKHTVEVHI